jgi:hypothetical protein
LQAIQISGLERKAARHGRLRQGPQDQPVIEVTLAADDDRTILVSEERGMPVDQLAAYGRGLQIDVEDPAAHLAGRERCDAAADGQTCCLPIGTWRPTSASTAEAKKEIIRCLKRYVAREIYRALLNRNSQPTALVTCEA